MLSACITEAIHASLPPRGKGDENFSRNFPLIVLNDVNI
jgi:hypothetical protein